MTKVSLPTTLTSIGFGAFALCTSLVETNLLHTNLLEIGKWAFLNCTKLRSMMLPLHSIQTLGDFAFEGCTKLVPSNMMMGAMIDTHDSDAVVKHLRVRR